MPDSRSVDDEARHETPLERFLFRRDEKRYLVFGSNRVVIAGLAFLALAMCGCLLLVTTKLFGLTAGVLTATIGALPFAVLWFALPMRRLHSLDGAKRRSTDERQR